MVRLPAHVLVPERFERRHTTADDDGEELAGREGVELIRVSGRVGGV